MTQIISQKYPKNTGWFDQGEWDDKYLGRVVSFTLCGTRFAGKVESCERYFLANGIHDILEVELIGDSKQVKIQLHRQAVTIIK